MLTWRLLFSHDSRVTCTGTLKRICPADMARGAIWRSFHWAHYFWAFPTCTVPGPEFQTKPKKSTFEILWICVRTFSQVPHDLICAKQPHHATSSGAKWPWWLKQTSFSWRCFSTLVALEWKVHFVIFEVMSTEVGTGATNASCIWHHFASWFDLLRHGAKSDTLGPTIRESWGIQFDHLRLHWRGWRWSRSNVGRWRGHVIR